MEEKRPTYPKGYFDGRAIDRFGYDALFVLISVCTCFLAFPFAYIVRKKWIISHTVVDGKRMLLSGTGGFLFKRYAVWLLLGVATLGVYWLAIPNRFTEFFVSNTTLYPDTGNAMTLVKKEGSRPVFDEIEKTPENTMMPFEAETLPCRFYGRATIRILVDLSALLVSVCSLGLLVPVAATFRERWFRSHSIIDGKQLSFHNNCFSYLAKWIPWWLLSIVTLGIMSFHSLNLLDSWIDFNTSLTEEGED